MVERYRTTVENGTIVVRNINVPNGTPVTVEIKFSDAPPFVLSADDVARLDASEAEIERGEYVTGEALIAQLRAAVRNPRQPHRDGTDRKRQRVAKPASAQRKNQARRRAR